MANVNFGDFTEKTTPAVTDFLVGYDPTGPSESRQTIANIVNNIIPTAVGLEIGRAHV